MSRWRLFESGGGERCGEGCSSMVCRLGGLFECDVAGCKDLVGLGRIRYQGVIAGSLMLSDWVLSDLVGMFATIESC